MKSGKLSPLLVMLMVVMGGILAGMLYFIVQGEIAVMDSPPLSLAVAGLVVMVSIGMVMVSGARSSCMSKLLRTGALRLRF